MSREDRRQKRVDDKNEPIPEVISEAIDEAEDSLVASNNRVADALDRIADLLNKLVTEKSNEIPK